MPTPSIFLAGLKLPSSIAVGPDGSLYVIESGLPGVTKILPSGARSSVGTFGGMTCTGVAVDTNGNIFTCFSGSCQVYKNNAPWANSPEIKDAQDLATDAAGNVYVACQGSNSVVKITAT